MPVETKPPAGIDRFVIVNGGDVVIDDGFVHADGVNPDGTVCQASAGVGVVNPQHVKLVPPDHPGCRVHHVHAELTTAGIWIYYNVSIPPDPNRAIAYGVFGFLRPGPGQLVPFGEVVLSTDERIALQPGDMTVIAP